MCLCYNPSLRYQRAVQCLTLYLIVGYLFVLQQVPQGLATVESEEVVERPSQGTPRGERPQGVAVQHALVVLDAQGAQDVAQVPGQG